MATSSASTSRWSGSITTPGASAAAAIHLGRRPARRARRALHRQQLSEVTTAAAAIGDHLELGDHAVRDHRHREQLGALGEHRTASRSPPRVVLLGDVADAADVQ
jgi:hypothetical protein